MKTLLALLLLSIAPAQAFAAPSPGMAIAAVVGGEAISSYDVDSRLAFVMTTAHLSDTPEVAARLRPQVIRSLVDEKLQVQEAARNNIAVTDADIAEAIATVEAQRDMPSGAIFAMLKDNRIPKETFINQIRAQLLWNKLMGKLVRPRIKIGEEEIKLAAARQVAPASGKRELEIAVLTLTVDKPSREQEIARLGQKLATEIRGGASFEELARQFSKGGGHATFWVRPEQLEPSIGRALSIAQEGSVTDPIRTGDGRYAIVKVYHVREEKAATPAPGLPAPERSPGFAQAGSDEAREQAAQQLFHQRIELEAEKYIRNLRRDAFIEIR